MGRKVQIAVFGIIALVAWLFDFALIISHVYAVAVLVTIIALVCSLRVWGAITRRASGTTAESAPAR